MLSANKLINKNIRINGDIDAVLSLPSNAANAPAMLLLHGFAADKNEVNSFYKLLADNLNKMGIVTLRIDFRCWGNSVGKTEESDIDMMIEDAITSLKYLHELECVDVNKIGILGFSLGAAIALLATDHLNVQTLTLISPAMNLISDFEAFLGKETIELLKCNSSTTEINLPWRTFNLSNKFYRSLLAHSPIESATRFTNDLLCIAGDRDFTFSNAENIMENSPSINKQLLTVQDADHIFNLPDGNSMLSKVGDMISTWVHQKFSTLSNTQSFKLK